MKPLFSLLFILLVTVCKSQPDLKHSLYISYKKCPKDANNKPLFLNGFLQHSNGNYYGTQINYTIPNNRESILYKLDNDFNVIWEKKYGGSLDDDFQFINELPNGNILLSGTTKSKDGDVWYGHSYSAQEIWLMEVDTLGNIIKGMTFGGGNGSTLDKIIISSDNQIYLSGSTAANDYDFTHFQYGFLVLDIWYAKLDTSLNLKWAKVLSGDHDEGPTYIDEISPNKFVISTSTESTNADFLPSQALGQGLVDVFTFCIDSSGTISWKNRKGSSLSDRVFGCHVDHINNFIYIVGEDHKIDHDFTYGTSAMSPYSFAMNMFFMRMDTLGNLKCGKLYGIAVDSLDQNNSETMGFSTSILYNDHIWLSAYTKGYGGDVDSNVNPLYENTFIAEVDSNCNLVGKYTINGEGRENATLNFIKDNKLYFSGSASKSLGVYNGFVCDTTAGVQSFIISLSEAPLSIQEVTKNSNSHSIFRLYPNPSDNKVNIQIENEFQNTPYTIKVLSADGKVLQQYSNRKGNTSIDCSAWQRGTYIITVELNKSKQSKQFFKQ
jgi:hypothetical protein